MVLCCGCGLRATVVAAERERHVQESVFKMWENIDDVHNDLADALNESNGVREADPLEYQGYNLRPPLSHCAYIYAHTHACAHSHKLTNLFILSRYEPLSVR
jgi:hypothetical protein